MWKSFALFSLLLPAVVGQCGSSSLVITGVLNTTTFKAVEFYSCAQIDNSSVYTLASCNNYYSFTGLPIASGQEFYLATNATASWQHLWAQANFTFDQLLSCSNSTVELWTNGSMVDVYGDNSISSWIGADGWAYRKPNKSASAAFVLGDWVVRSGKSIPMNTGFDRFPLFTFNDAVPSIVELSGCATNGANASGCSAQLTIVGSMFNTTSIPDNNVSFSGPSPLPSCITTSVDHFYVICTLTIPVGANGTWQVWVSVSGVQAAGNIFLTVPNSTSLPCTTAPGWVQYSNSSSCTLPVVDGGSCALDCWAGTTPTGSFICSNGTWNMPTCVPLASTCVGTPNITNGVSNCSGITAENTTCAVMCNPTYDKMADAICTNGTFQNPDMFCIFNPNCTSQPTWVQNGTSSCSLPTPHNGTCALTCDSGTNKTGDFKCSNGLWSMESCLNSSALFCNIYATTCGYGGVGAWADNVACIMGHGTALANQKLCYSYYLNRATNDTGPGRIDDCKYAAGAHPCDSANVTVTSISGCATNGAAATNCATATLITLTGYGFDDLHIKQNLVRFVGGTAGTATCTVIAATLTQIQCHVGTTADVAGTWSASVTVNGVDALGAVTATFLPLPPPTISGVTGCATNGAAATGCQGGTLVTITGTGFDAVLPVNNDVKFTGGTAGQVWCGPISEATSTSVTCPLVASTDVAGTWTVQVTTDSVAATGTATLTAIPKPTPTVTSVQGCDISGSAAKGCRGGSWITISGTGFNNYTQVLNEMHIDGGSGTAPTCRTVNAISTTQILCELVVRNDTSTTDIWLLVPIIDGVPVSGIVTMTVIVTPAQLFCLDFEPTCGLGTPHFANHSVCVATYNNTYLERQQCFSGRLAQAGGQAGVAKAASCLEATGRGPCGLGCLIAPLSVPNSQPSGCPSTLPAANGTSCGLVCDTNYIKSADYWCLDGNWTTPQCTLLQCTSQPTNGNLTATPACTLPAVNGSTCNVTCQPGHDPVLPFYQCLESGNWTAASCSPSPCTSQPFAGANCSLPTVSGGYCANNCSSGFMSSGDFWCDKGVWTNATCISLDCTVAPLAPLNGSVPSNCTLPASNGTACNAVCDAGFEPSGPHSCVGGNWSSVWCNPMGCSMQPTPGPFMSAPNCTLPAMHNSTCTAACASGLPSGDYWCMMGSWVVPTCGSLNCTTAPSAPLNGSAPSNCSIPAMNGTTCNAVCDSGFAPSGPHTCWLGTWSNVTCNPAECTTQPVASANMEAPNCTLPATHNSTCTATCSAGSDKVGNDHWCDRGMWVSPTCVPRGCTTQPALPTNANQGNPCTTLPVLHGATCPLTCAAGYAPVGGAFTCSMGLWSAPTCERANCTAQPAQVASSQPPQCTVPASHGATCSLTCISGFQASGDYVCNGGQWSAPTCTAIPCTTMPPPVTDGTNNCQLPVSSGGVCPVTCTGALVESGDWVCSYGVWQGPITCVAPACSTQPNQVANADAPNCKPTADGNKCTLTCQPGYAKSADYVCQAGQWSTPTCGPAPCTVEPVASGGALPGNCTLPAPSGSTCKLYCQVDFTPSNDFTCTMGQWSTASCTQLPCTTQPATVTNGVSPTCTLPAAHGTNCQLDCTAGNAPSGLYQCHNGQWSMPTCGASACSSQPAQANNTSVPPQCTLPTTSGGTCTTTCSTGYTLASPYTCQAGQWTAANCAGDPCTVQPTAVASAATPTCALPAASGSTCALTCNSGFVASGDWVCTATAWNAPTCGAIAALPTFNPAAGTVASGTTIAVTSTGSALVCYTNDGSTPACGSDLSHCAAGSLKTDAAPVFIIGAVTIKAIGCAAGSNSAVATADFTTAATNAQPVVVTPANNTQLTGPQALTATSVNARAICYSANYPTVVPACDAAHAGCVGGVVYSAAAPPQVQAGQVVALIGCASAGDSVVAVVVFPADMQAPTNVTTTPDLSQTLPSGTTSITLTFHEPIQLATNATVWLALRAPAGSTVPDRYIQVPSSALSASGSSLSINLNNPAFAGIAFDSVHVGVVAMPNSISDTNGNALATQLGVGAPLDSITGRVPGDVLYVLQNVTTANGSVVAGSKQLILTATDYTHICYQFEPYQFASECLAGAFGTVGCSAGQVFDTANPPVINATVKMSAVACGFNGAGPNVLYTVSPNGTAPTPPSPAPAPRVPAPTPMAPSDKSGAGEEGKGNGSLIAGMVILGVALLLAIIGVAAFMMKKKSAEGKSDNYHGYLNEPLNGRHKIGDDHL